MIVLDEILLAFKKAGTAAFRSREYAALLGKKAYARLVLHRLKNRGEIVFVRNGWWAFPDSVVEAIASEVSKPCYVSFHSALFLNGLTTQIPAIVQIAVARKPKNYKIFERSVKEFRIQKSQFNGFYRKEGVLLASPEKAFFDALALPRTCSEIVLLEALKKLDIDKINPRTIAEKKRLKRLIKNVEQN